ncbi:MAG TPA: DUF5343 domain-containing protein [Polyangia bacterium]|nr:DUF5343 domain-containing protein [Polyangia bacterium]
MARPPKSRGGDGQSGTKPLFPYTTRPAALRRFLAEVPKRPRPAKIDPSLLASWEIKGGEAMTIIRVLKALKLLGQNNEPTDAYVSFMHAGTGPAALAQQIREVYAPVFGASLEPYKESNDALKNLFNIHSGGAPAVIDLQIATFKALCEYADFSGAAPPAVANSSSSKVAVAQAGSAPKGAREAPGDFAPVAVTINLHIHLPEGKSSRDYQYIIQDIAKYIYRYSDVGDEREK